MDDVNIQKISHRQFNLELMEKAYPDMIKDRWR